MNQKKTVVAGGAGFVGANLCLALARMGHEVAVIDNLSTGKNASEVTRQKRCRLVTRDVRKMTPDEAQDIFEGAQTVYNLVGRTWHGRSMRDPVGDAEANLAAPLAVLAWSRKFCPEAHVVYTGTRGQYGQAQSLPVYEDHPMHPLDVNGINKKAAEEAHMLFAQHGMKTTSLRLPNIFGPYHQTETPDGVVNWFITQALRGESLTVYGGVRDILCSCEVTSALIRCAGRPECFGRAFNVGGRPMKLMEYASIVGELTGASVSGIEPREEATIHPGDFHADASALKEACGWDLAHADIRDLIAETVEWYRRKVND